MRLVPFSCFALLACLAAAASARAEAPDGGAPTGVLTRPPRLIHFVPAPYPPEAEAQRLLGDVLLQIDVDASGQVTQAQVIHSAGHGFDESALAAVKQFQFAPAEIDGKPAAVRLTYRYAFVFTPEPDAGPPPAKHAIVFEGRALERGNRDPLPLAQVVAQPVGMDGGALPPAVHAADRAGRFAFEDLPPGTYRVSVIAPDHDRFDTLERLERGTVTHATYYVRRRADGAYQTVVTAEREKKEVARTTLRQEEIRLIPGTQGDALKVVQNLPGVARAPYGLGLLIVRGSKPWDTRVYIDDAVVPQLFHFGALTSVFNADLLDDIGFQPGNFNVDHGRAIGGLITGQSREPSTQGLHGYANVNVIDSSLLLEGPLTDEISLAVAGRRSYVDTVLDKALPVLVPGAGLDFTVAPRYWDYQLKLDYHPKNRPDRYQLLAFGSDDKLALLLQNPASVDPEARASIESHVGFDMLEGAWIHPFADKTLRNRLSAVAGYTGFTSAFGGDLRGGSDYYLLALRDALGKDFSPRLSADAGVDLLGGPYKYFARSPTLFRFDQVPDPVLSRQLISDEGTGMIFEPAAYAQLTAKPFAGTTAVPGIRADYDGTLHRFWADPRLAAFQALPTGTTLKAAAGLYHQPPDFRQGLVLPKFGNPDLGPEASQQYMVGFEQRIADGLHVDVQGYYKWLFDQVETSNRIVVRDGQLVPERLDNGGTGRSYGVELLLRRDLTRRFFGWIAYSLEKTQLCSASYAQSGTKPVCTPFGKDNWTPFPLDQPQHLVAVLSYKLPYGFICGIRAQYASGNPITPVASAVYDADGDVYFPIPGAPYSERVPAFFQLDARVDKRFVFDPWMLTVYLDVQNVTNRRNVEYTLYNYDYSQRTYLRGLPIVPALGVRGDF